MKLNMRLKSCSPILVLLVLTFVAMPLPATKTVTTCGVGASPSRSCVGFKSACIGGAGDYKETGWYDRDKTKVASATCTMAVAPPKPQNGFPSDSLNVVRPNSYAQPQTARTTLIPRIGNCTFPPCPWETNQWPWNGTLSGMSARAGTKIVLLDANGSVVSQARVNPDGSYSLSAPRLPLQGIPTVCVALPGSQQVCGKPGDNEPNLTLGGRSVRVTSKAGMASATPGTPGQKAGRTSPAVSPCDEWQRGGTIFDATECEHLLRRGSFTKDKQVFATSGTTLKWRIGLKKTAATAPASMAAGRFDRSPHLEGFEVLVINMHDKSIVARARTEPDGSFQFTIPSTVSGELQLRLNLSNSSAKMVESDDGRSFDFCTLPSEENVLTPMCEDDPPIVVRPSTNKTGRY